MASLRAVLSVHSLQRPLKCEARFENEYLVIKYPNIDRRIWLFFYLICYCEAPVEVSSSESDGLSSSKITRKSTLRPLTFAKMGRPFTSTSQRRLRGGTQAPADVLAGERSTAPSPCPLPLAEYRRKRPSAHVALRYFAVYLR